MLGSRVRPRAGPGRGGRCEHTDGRGCCAIVSSGCNATGSPADRPRLVPHTSHRTDTAWLTSVHTPQLHVPIVGRVGRVSTHSNALFEIHLKRRLVEAVGQAAGERGVIQDDWAVQG